MIYFSQQNASVKELFKKINDWNKIPAESQRVLYAGIHIYK